MPGDFLAPESGAKLVWDYLLCEPPFKVRSGEVVMICTVFLNSRTPYIFCRILYLSIQGHTVLQLKNTMPYSEQGNGAQNA